ncbi:thermonuclease family protein [Devosia sp. XK-2]|uniref:thermonuclease family protein n=1 Tax=Devosia sp. XK-2 TaxID=3126689 RepID=UPI0030CCFBC6
MVSAKGDRHMGVIRQSYGRGGTRRRTVRRRRNRVLEMGQLLAVALAAIALGGAVTRMVDEGRLTDWLLGAAPAAASVAPEVYSRHFAICSSAKRDTCIVDGDTFWLDGTKIRIADINTPEISSPQCAREAQLGRQATSRLAQLLNAGPFSLAPADRDEDRYGRKLRIVERDGRSVGAQLVAEGLAHEWQGARRGWC